MQPPEQIGLSSQRLVELRRELEVCESGRRDLSASRRHVGDQAGTIITQQLSQTNAELAVARDQQIKGGENPTYRSSKRRYAVVAI